MAAGKTITARAVARRVGARAVSVEDVRQPGQASLQSVLDAVAKWSAQRTVIECSGTTGDFETFLLRLGALGYTVTVIKLVCAVETAHDRLRTTRAGAAPRSGLWATQLRWVERRLRAVPADATIATDALTPPALAAEVLARWDKTAPPGHADGQDGWQDTSSFSQLAAYERCPLAYRLRYLEGRDSPYRFYEELLGHVVHAGLAWLYRTRDIRRGATLGDLLAIVRAAAVDLPISTNTASLVEKVSDEAAVILRRHYVGAFAGDRSRTLAVEKRFALDLGGAISFVGIIDRLAESPAGIPVVIDYKTATAPPRPTSNIPDILQLEGYGLAALLESRAPVVELRRHYVRKGEEEVEVLRRSEIERVRLALLRWIRRVNRAIEFPARPTKLCAWCRYNPDCSSRDGPMRDPIEMVAREVSRVRAVSLEPPSTA